MSNFELIDGRNPDHASVTYLFLNSLITIKRWEKHNLYKIAVSLWFVLVISSLLMHIRPGRIILMKGGIQQLG